MRGFSAEYAEEHFYHDRLLDSLLQRDNSASVDDEVTSDCRADSVYTDPPYITTTPVVEHLVSLHPA